MRNKLKISTIAVVAAMLATLPASALSLNLGGNNGGGLLGLGGSGSTSGGSSSTGASVNVNTGNLLGGNSSGNDRSLVTLGGTDDGVINLGNGDDLLNIGGRNGATVNADLGTGGNGVLNLGGDDPVTANVNLGGGQGTDANVLLDLFGSGDSSDGTIANVSLGNSGNGLLNLGNGNGPANIANVTVGTSQGGADVTADLFGTGAGGGNGGSGGGVVPGHGPVVGPVTPIVPMPGSPGGTDVAENGPADGAIIVPPSGTVAAPALTAANGCFTPTSAQADKLANRHSYGSATFSSWANVTSLKVVDVNLCGGAGGGITASANVDRLQNFIGSNKVLSTSLGKTGHSPDDVIAVDKSGRTLVLYVM